MQDVAIERGCEVNDVELLAAVAAAAKEMHKQINQRIVGQGDVVSALLAAVFSQGHVLVIGVPGLAKTLLVKTLAEVLDWRFQRIQFTPDMMPSDITGMELLQYSEDGRHRNMAFVPGPVFANLILGDEINRTPPKTQSALLEVMQEYHVTSMGKCYPIEKPFVVVATQNPIEQEGTYPLPEAQLDRFMFSLWVDYPSREEEEQIVARTTAPFPVDIQPVVSVKQMQAFQDLVFRLPVSAPILSYAVTLARATRPADPECHPLAKRYVEWGAGPRAGQHMILAAKAMAALEGEATVAIQHVRLAAPYVLNHRVVVNYQAAGEGLTARSLIDQIIRSTPPPVKELVPQ